MLNRRDLFRTAAVFSAASYQRILGANDRVNLGLIGAGDRGSFVMSVFQKNSTVDVKAICDVYGTRLDEALTKAPGAKGFNDHRKLLELKELDAVLIATPDHWHAGCAINAVRAGKDVYCEKPLTLKIEEGPVIVKEARIHDRVFQVGMQQRSGPHYMKARDEYIQAGKLGKITMARTWWHGNGYHLRKAPAALQTQPSSLDWAQFLGPVKWREYDPQQYYNFRAYLDFGGGQVTDLFHALDRRGAHVHEAGRPDCGIGGRWDLQL
jgi:predicted dehydrogenase